MEESESLAPCNPSPFYVNDSYSYNQQIAALAIGIVYTVLEVLFLFFSKQIIYNKSNQQKIYRHLFIVSFNIGLIMRTIYFYLMWAAPSFKQILIWKKESKGHKCESDYAILGVVNFFSNTPTMFEDLAFICFAALLAHYLINIIKNRYCKYKILKYFLFIMAALNSFIFLAIEIASWATNNNNLLGYYRIYWSSCSFLLVSSVSIHFIIQIRKFWKETFNIMKLEIYIVLSTTILSLFARLFYDIFLLAHYYDNKFLVNGQKIQAFELTLCFYFLIEIVPCVGFIYFLSTPKSTKYFRRKGSSLLDLDSGERDIRGFSTGTTNESENSPNLRNSQESLSRESVITQSSSQNPRYSGTNRTSSPQDTQRPFKESIISSKNHYSFGDDSD